MISLLVSDFRKIRVSVPSIPVAVLDLTNQVLQIYFKHMRKNTFLILLQNGRDISEEGIGVFEEDWRIKSIPRSKLRESRLGSFTNYVYKTRQVVGTGKFNGMQIFHYFSKRISSLMSTGAGEKLSNRTTFCQRIIFQIFWKVHICTNFLFYQLETQKQPLVNNF